MKSVKETIPVLLPFVLALSMYIVFYSKIECKPNQAGFWLIIALGASIGVVITRFSQKGTITKNDDQ